MTIRASFYNTDHVGFQVPVRVALKKKIQTPVTSFCIFCGLRSLINFTSLDNTHKTSFRVQVKGHGEGSFATSREDTPKIRTGPEDGYRRLFFIKKKTSCTCFIKKIAHYLIKIEQYQDTINQNEIQNLLFY